MIISLVFGALAGVLATQLEPKLGEVLAAKGKTRLESGKLQVLAFAVALLVAGVLAELAGSAQIVWLALAGIAGYFWKDIRAMIGK